MCNYLNDFDFSSSDHTTITTIVEDVIKFLKKAEAYLSNTAATSPTPSPNTSSVSDPLAATPEDTSPLALKVEYKEGLLDDPLVAALKKDLSKFDYIPTGAEGPDVALFGDRPYVYSKATKDLKHTAITDSSTIGQVLDIVNLKLGKNYNSVLVNSI